MTESEINEELGWIKEAKKAIYLTGSSYSRSGLQLTRASLAGLIARENDLRKQLSAINGTNSFFMDFR